MRVKPLAQLWHWRRTLLAGVAACALSAVSFAACAQSTDAPNELPALPEMKLDVPPPDVPTPPIPVDGMPSLPPIPANATSDASPAMPSAPLPEPAPIAPPPDLSAEPAAPIAEPVIAEPAVATPAVVEPVMAPEPVANIPEPVAEPAVTEPAAATPEVPAAPAAEPAAPVADAVKPADKQEGEAEAATTKTKPTPVIDTEAAWSGTLMFDPSRMDQMNNVYEQYLLSESRKVKTNGKNVKGGPDIAKIIEDKLKGKEIKEEELEFSLDSILYYTDADWSIWVSGKRYFRDEAMAGFDVGSSHLAVTDVNSHEVNFVWTPISESFDKVQKRWDDKQRLSENGPSPQLAVGERVEFDADAQIVNILMRPNQTFVSTFMSVLEGKDNRAPVAAVGKGKASDAKGAKDAKAPAEAPAASPAGAATGEPNLSDIQKMPDGNAKDRAMADHLSNMYKNAFPGMTQAIENGERLEAPVPTQ